MHITKVVTVGVFLMHQSNPDPPTLGHVGLKWGFITILATPVCGGFVHFVALFLKNVGH